MFVELLLLSLSSVTSASQQFWPSRLPLLLRSPYFNSWIDTNVNIANEWPQFWTDNHILGWNCQARIDGQSYAWLGSDGNSTSNLIGFAVTPTRTILTFESGNMIFNATFLSPIEPEDLVLQSFPFGYLYIDAQSTDEWLADNISAPMQWSFTQTSSTMYHQAQLVTTNSMQEDVGQLAQDGTFYFAASKGTGVTYQTSNSTVSRPQFINNGTLINSVTRASPGVINDNWPLFALAMDMGQTSSIQSSPVWAVGLVRNTSIVYATGAGNQTRNSYFWSKYPSISDAIDAFLNDFPQAKSRADNLDQQILSQANSISSNYADLVSFSLRQTLASLEITLPVPTSGNTNTSDVLMFMKDMGNSQRTNPVEALFASFPTLLSLNATYGGYLLEPLLRFQNTFIPSQVYSPPDLGVTFPSVQGNVTSGSTRAIEDSGSMLIMLWAHAKYSGDTSLISRYYPILKLWTDFLVQNSLGPTGFVSCDGLGNANMTNLAVKGILGIRAFAEISSVVGQGNVTQYNSTAQSYIQQWQTAASGSGHLQATYGQGTSWALIYNMYADKWLGFNLVNSSVYNSQNTFYGSLLTSSAKFGIPFDSTLPSEVKAQWTMLTAATVSDSQVRNGLINSVYERVGTNLTGGVSSTYDATSGNVISGIASPAFGAMSAFMAMNLPSRLSGSSATTGSDSDSGSGGSSGSKKNIGAIVGGVLGGLLLIGLVAASISLYRRYARRRGGVVFKVHYDESLERMVPFQGPSTPDATTTGYALTPITPPSTGYTPSPATPPSITGHPPAYRELRYVPPAAPHSEHSAGQSVLTNPWGPSTTSGSGSDSSANRAPRRRAPGGTPQSSSSGASDSSSGRQAPPLPRKVRGNAPQARSAESPTSGGGETALRSEIDALRREMEEMRMNQAPPQYSGES